MSNEDEFSNCAKQELRTLAEFVKNFLEEHSQNGFVSSVVTDDGKSIVLFALNASELSLSLEEIQEVLLKTLNNLK